MFKDKLYTIMKDLNHIKSKNNVLEKCVNSRLNGSLKDYTDSVERTCSYLLTRSNYKVLKNIAKQQSEGDN